MNRRMLCNAEEIAFWVSQGGPLNMFMLFKNIPLMRCTQIDGTLNFLRP